MKDIIYGLPTFELGKNERIWLNEIYMRVINYEKTNSREIWSKLYGRIPKNFDPSQINKLLAESSGERITLLGVIALTDEKEVIPKVDKIFYTIQRNILQNPQLNEFDISVIANEIGLDTREVGLWFDLASRYGNFFNSATLDYDTKLPVKVSIGEEGRYFNQYLRFSGISEIIREYVLEEKKRSKGLPEKGDIHTDYSHNELGRVNTVTHIRDKLIPENFNIKISNSKVESIFQELKKINVTIYTNASAVLLRVFIELTIDCYLEANSLIDSNSATKSGLDLKQKIFKVTNNLETKKLADSSICKGIRSGVKEKDGLLGVDTLHAYVHNNNFSPKEKDLITTWDNIQKFIEIVWTNTT